MQFSGWDNSSDALSSWVDYASVAITNNIILFVMVSLLLIFIVSFIILVVKLIKKYILKKSEIKWVKTLIVCAVSLILVPVLRFIQTALNANMFL